MHATPTATDAWGSTTTLEELARWLSRCERVVVLTHVKPDGDAVGSTLALVRALNHGRAPRAEAWYFPPLPPWVKDVADGTAYRVIEKDGPAAHLDPDAIVVVDTGSWAQLDPVHDWLAARHERVAIIDHHVKGDAGVAPLRVVDTTAAAACQPVGELARLVLGAPSLSRLPRAVATPLYLGLATDTGWFRHSNVGKAVMATAGELLEAGAENVRLYQIVEQRDSPGRLRLLARALASLELHEGGRVATMALRLKDFAESGAEPGESGGFVDLPQNVPGVMVTVLLTEAGTAASPLTKLSMRSKDVDGAIDVNLAATAFGGGGHVRAAGARLPMDLDAARPTIVRELARQLVAKG